MTEVSDDIRSVRLITAHHCSLVWMHPQESHLGTHLKQSFSGMQACNNPSLIPQHVRHSALQSLQTHHATATRCPTVTVPGSTWPGADDKKDKATEACAGSDATPRGSRPCTDASCKEGEGEGEGEGGGEDEDEDEGSMDESLESLTAALDGVSLEEPRVAGGKQVPQGVAPKVEEVNEWPGGWEGSSKLRCLVKDVEDMLRKDASAKCVCFSQVSGTALTGIRTPNRECWLVRGQS